MLHSGRTPTDTETVREPRTTRWGERYMAGTTRRMFLPQPEELRRTYGENATAAASMYGSLPPAMPAVFALMAVIAVLVFALAGGGGPGFPGWAVGLLVLDVATACVLLTVIIMHKAKRLASLRSARS